MKNPDILLCDEPTGALDYNTSKEILKLIEDVNQKYGNTIIMVTHNDANQEYGGPDCEAQGRHDKTQHCK